MKQKPKISWYVVTMHCKVSLFETASRQHPCTTTLIGSIATIRTLPSVTDQSYWAICETLADRVFECRCYCTS